MIIETRDLGRNYVVGSQDIKALSGLSIAVARGGFLGGRGGILRLPSRPESRGARSHSRTAPRIAGGSSLPDRATHRIMIGHGMSGSGHDTDADPGAKPSFEEEK
jgi:hypothetical protein